MLVTPCLHASYSLLLAPVILPQALFRVASMLQASMPAAFALIVAWIVA